MNPKRKQTPKQQWLAEKRLRKNALETQKFAQETQKYAQERARILTAGKPIISRLWHGFCKKKHNYPQEFVLNTFLCKIRVQCEPLIEEARFLHQKVLPYNSYLAQYTLGFVLRHIIYKGFGCLMPGIPTSTLSTIAPVQGAADPGKACGQWSYIPVEGEHTQACHCTSCEGTFFTSTALSLSLSISLSRHIICVFVLILNICTYMYTHTHITV